MYFLNFRPSSIVAGIQPTVIIRASSRTGPSTWPPVPTPTSIQRMAMWPTDVPKTLLQSAPFPKMLDPI